MSNIEAAVSSINTDWEWEVGKWAKHSEKWAVSQISCVHIVFLCISPFRFRAFSLLCLLFGSDFAIYAKRCQYFFLVELIFLFFLSRFFASVIAVHI